MFLGRYEVIRKIGSGGFGEVLLARSIGAEGFERIVALKRLKGELARKVGSLKGIINEARIGGLLNHPNIVQVLEFIQIGPDYLLVMEYVDGVALHEILEMERDSGRLLTPGLALDIVIQTCEGLHYAHAARSVTGVPLNLIHRDIKPSNLMVTKTGTVKIMDFGVARSATNMGHSSTGSIKGTLRYLSPEQAEGSKEIGHGSDLFSLGLVLCEMITGKPVYEAPQEHLVLLQALQAQTADAVEEAEALVPGIGPILASCLDPDPEARFETADALAQSLRRLKKDFPIGTGLPEMVARAYEIRLKTYPEEEIEGETTFSLELRRKGMDRVRPDLNLNLVVGRQKAAPSANDSSESRKERAGKEDEGGFNEDEAWEWEWRVTSYPATKSELDDCFEDELNYDGPEKAPDDGRVVSPAPGVESSPPPLFSGAEDPASAAGVAPDAESASFLPSEGAPATSDKTATPPSERKSKGMSILSIPALQFVAGIVLAMVLVGLGFVLGLSYQKRSVAATPALLPESVGAAAADDGKM